MSNIFFKKTLIIGLGLIGGSFAKAIAKNKLSEKIFALDFNNDSIDLALADNTINEASNDISKLSAEKFDLIVIATPLSAYQEIFTKIENKINPDSIIIDLGSLKQFIANILPKKLQNNFIGCHPIAGLEKSGFEHSNANLFNSKKFIICPNNNTQAKLIKKISDLTQKIGCENEIIDAAKHDNIYALVSHLPQFLSFLSSEFSPENIKDEFFAKAFRLDNSNSKIWTDIFDFNVENIEKFYLQFFDNLEELLTTPKNLHKIIPSNQTSANFDQEFFRENFAAIFFRLLMVTSYLRINDIKNYQDYSGTGFKDFISILEVLNYDKDQLKILINKNYDKILKIFNKIS